MAVLKNGTHKTTVKVARHDPLNAKNPHRDGWRNPSWFADAFQKEPGGGEGDFGVVKLSADAK